MTRRREKASRDLHREGLRVMRARAIVIVAAGAANGIDTPNNGAATMQLQSTEARPHEGAPAGATPCCSGPCQPVWLGFCILGH